MTLRLIFSPPQLPSLLSGDDVVAHIANVHPELTPGSLGPVAEETDNYNRLRHEYDRRNIHYAEWIQWSNGNPGGKEQLLAFLNDHRGCFDASCESLKKLDAVIASVTSLPADGAIRIEIQGMEQQASADARVLADNIVVISAPDVSAASGQSANTADSGTKILPQKRARVEEH